MISCPVCQKGLRKVELKKLGILWSCREHGSLASEFLVVLLKGKDWLKKFLSSPGHTSPIACPYCRKKMQEKEFENLKLDHCRGCRAIWFDVGEYEILSNPIQVVRNPDPKFLKEKRAPDLFDVKEATAETVSNPLELLGLPMIERSKARSSLMPATVLLLVINIMVGIALFRHNGLRIEGWAFFPEQSLPQNGFRILGAGLAHAGWQHLLSNMFGLWIFGEDIEDDFGSLFLIELFVVGVVFGNLLYKFTGGIVPTVGASGGVFGLMAFYVLTFPHRRIRLIRFFFVQNAPRAIQIILPVWIYFGFSILVEIFSGFGQLAGHSSQINHIGHLGGAAAGLLFYLFAQRRYSRS